MKKTFLAGIGDSNDPLTWSGTPFHLLEAGRQAGILDEGLTLNVDSRSWKIRRVLWNARRLILGWRPGGFQYSAEFLERLYAPFHNKLQGSRIINWFQLYPPSIVANQTIDKWFYIDMTLKQLFESYGAGEALDQRTITDALERETAGYRAAEGIMTLSEWAAQSVIEDYGIPAERVHAIAPGANIRSDVYSEWYSTARFPESEPAQPLQLVFTGKCWHRKGLDRLLEAFLLAQAHGANLALRVIGVDPATVPLKYRNALAIEWVGFLDKRAEPATFLNAVSGCDVGVLLSRADASPIAVREYCALGLVTLCTNVGGTPEMALAGASVLIPAEASDEEIADALIRLCEDRQATERMRERAWGLRREALWHTAAIQMQGCLEAQSTLRMRLGPIPEVAALGKHLSSKFAS